MKEQEKDIPLGVRVMLRDRTVDESDLIIAKRKGKDIFEVVSNNVTMDLTPREASMRRAVDNCWGCVVYVSKPPYNTKRVTQIKRAGVIRNAA